MSEPSEDLLLLHRVAGALCAGAWREPCRPYGADTLSGRLRADLDSWVRTNAVPPEAAVRLLAGDLEVEETDSDDEPRATFQLRLSLSGTAELCIPIPDPVPPVSFRSDIDGDLFLFTDSLDAPRWEVQVVDTQGGRRRIPLSREPFLAVSAGHDAPAWHAFCIDCLDGAWVEIRRSGLPPARIRPRGWPYDQPR